MTTRKDDTWGTLAADGSVPLPVVLRLDRAEALAKRQRAIKRDLDQRMMIRPSTKDWHITDIRNGGVYGHTTDHCDPAGCNGDEMFLTDVDPEEVDIGECYEIIDDGRVGESSVGRSRVR